MTLDIKINLSELAAAGILFLWSCGTHSQETGRPEEIRNEQQEMVTLTENQALTAGIQAGTFSYLRMGEAVQANGTVELPPNNLVSISVPMEGFVENIRFLEGSRVRKGEVLVVMQHPAYIQLQQDYLQALSLLTYLTQDMGRQETLSEAHVNSGKTVEKTRTDLAMQEAEVAALREKLRYLGVDAKQLETGHIQPQIYLRAPFSGTVTQLNVHKGELVTPGNTIMEVINREHMHLELQVFQRDIPKVKEGQRILFTIPAFDLEQLYEGEVSLVGKSLDLESKTIRVHGHFEETELLIPGLYIEAKIMADEHRRRVLPVDAVILENDQPFYFTQVAAENGTLQFVKTPIVTGVTDKDWVEVVAVDPQADTLAIVTDGAFYLRSGQEEADEE